MGNTAFQQILVNSAVYVSTRMTCVVVVLTTEPMGQIIAMQADFLEMLVYTVFVVYRPRSILGRSVFQ